MSDSSLLQMQESVPGRQRARTNKFSFFTKVGKIKEKDRTEVCCARSVLTSYFSVHLVCCYYYYSMPTRGVLKTLRGSLPFMRKLPTQEFYLPIYENQETSFTGRAPSQTAKA